MVDTRTFRWSGGALVADVPEQATTNHVRVADSWLTVDGAVAGLDRHIERFSGSVRHAFPQLDVESFARAALADLPRTGRWFPRIEAIEDGGGPVLRLRIREAPEPLTHVSVATATRDPRSDPSVKGPDLAELGALRTELGAGEAIILDEGFIAEGAWSNIVWWRDDALHVVDSSIARLPGVTESLILDHARSIGTTVVSARTRPEELDGTEVWVLSALHGIRIATEWRAGPSLRIEPGRAEHWRSEYVHNRQVVFPL
jgi:branched-subunit amino acid aminotransferase/4-amino-4-deoxychorismate lyase